ncbi:MAG: oligosaccharide flippase family protein [Bacteroidota bacterium]
MDAANRVALNTGILYAKMAITVFISLYTTRLVLAALGANDYGIFNVVGGAISMLTFLNAAMTSATQRFMSYSHGEEDERKQKRIFNVSVLLHIVIGILVVIILEIAGIFLFDGILTIEPDRIDVAKLIYHFLVVSTFVKIISVPYNAVINAHENMLFVAILGILEALGKLSIAFYVTYTGLDKLAAYGFLMAALAVLLLIILRIYCHRKYSEVTINIRKYFEKALFKEMTIFAGWSFLNSAASLISMQGMAIVLNSFFGTVANAAQGIANQVAGQLMAFSHTMLKALNPVLVKSEGGKRRKQMIYIAMTGSKFSFFLLAFFAVPFLLETSYILNAWLKDVPKWAIIFCRLELIRNLILQLTIVVQSGISAEGRIKNYSIVRSISYFLPLPLTAFVFWLGAPPYAMYIIWILVWSIGGVFIVLYYAHKNYDLSISAYIKKVLLPGFYLFSATMLVGSVPMFVMESSFLRLLLVGFLTSSTYLIFLWYVSLDYVEKELIASIIKKFTQKYLKKEDSAGKNEG